LRRQVEALLSSDKSARDHVKAAVSAEFEGFHFPLTGETVSHYRVLNGLGGGGMGLVYRAEDIKLGRSVAIKFLPEESANNAVALSRFEREARSASALEHPNICPVYEFGEHDSRPFLVMQLLEGQTLRELLESKSDRSQSSTAGTANVSLMVERIIDFAIQIASGLEAAHRKGIIHRDIKPGNIFVTREGQVKILDFGLAKLAREVAVVADALSSPPFFDPSREDRATLNPFVSRTGVAIGTAAYMSPEQIRGETLDVRTDLFSFGLVMYEMATGLHAFTGHTDPQLHAAILNTTPTPVREVNPQIPAKLERIVKKAIEKDRETRYQTASEIRAELEALKREVSTTRIRRRVAVAAGSVTLLLAGAFLLVARHRPSVAQVLPEISFRQLTMNSSDNAVTSGSISPDGRYLAYMDDVGMHVRNIETGSTQIIPPPEVLKAESRNWDIVSAGWLDNTRFIANAHPTNERGPYFWSSQTTSIWLFSRMGTPPQLVRDHAIAWSVSPGGVLISFGNNAGRLGERELWVMSPDGVQLHKLLDTDDNSSVAHTFWSPDGQYLLYVQTDASGDTILGHRLNGGPPTTLFTPAETKQLHGDLVWLPDGRLIYQLAASGSGTTSPQEGCNFWAMRLDASSGTPTEKPSRLTNRAGSCISSANASADGKRIGFLEQSGDHGTVYMADIEAGDGRIINERHFTLDEGDDSVTDWAPDSKAVIVIRNADDHYDLYRQPLNGDMSQPIVTVAPGLVEHSLVSPDGNWVIIQVWPAPGSPWGAAQSIRVPIVRVPINGGSPEELFRVRTGSLISCSKAPANLCVVAEQSDDKKQLIFTSFDAVKGRGDELARFDIDPEMSLDYYLQGRVSPDGAHLFALRSAKGPIEIRSIRGGPARTIQPRNADDMFIVGWAADSRGLYVMNRTTLGIELLYTDLYSNTQLLRSCRNGSLRQDCGGVPSPDGRHFALGDRKRTASMWMMENF
jgi:serine/threonine protein kinase